MPSMRAPVIWGSLAATLCLPLMSAVRADTFRAAHYDPKTDELVVTMMYGGTNPDHSFSIQWGKCQRLGEDGTLHQVAAQVLDGQWRDTARQDFTKTVRFPLASLHCRPAEVTLHTAPRFYYTLLIPTRSELAGGRSSSGDCHE